MTTVNCPAKTVILLLAIVLVGGLVGCSEPVYHGLSESDANEMVVLLEQNGIEASKAPDPAADEAWIVEVPTAQSSSAWQILEREGLPRRDISGFESFYPSGGLVPTENEERVLLQFSTSQELTRSLLKVDGIVDAQVNLVLPEKPAVQLETTVVEPPRASVLVKYRADLEKPPLTRKDIARLVAGGVEGLDPEQINVIFTRASRVSEPLQKPKTEAVGPIAVASESKSTLQILIGIMGACIVGLSGGLVFFVLRVRRSKEGDDG